jgi:adenylate cyclase
MLAVCCNAFGDFKQAAERGRRALDCYDPALHGQQAWRYVHDLGAAAASHLAIGLWHLGHIDEALKYEQFALERAHAVSHQNTIGYALTYAGALAALRRRDFGALRSFAQRMQEHGSNHGMPQWVAWGTCLEVPAIAVAGDPDQGIQQYSLGIKLCDRLNNLALRPLFYSGLAEAQLISDEPASALETIVMALRTSERSAERWADSELHRLRGMAFRQLGNDSEAEDAFCRAMVVAEEQGSKSLQLRVASSLARLWLDRSNPVKARSLLAPIYSEFREGFQTPDRKEAGLLMCQLGESSEHEPAAP